MIGWRCCSALFAALAVWMWLCRNVDWTEMPGLRGLCLWSGTGDDTDAGDGHDATDERIGETAAREPSVIGATACVAALRASVRSGATLVEAFEQLQGSSFAVPELTRFRIAMAVRSRCSSQERHDTAEDLDVELYAACALSLSLGCETGRCLEAVAASLRRQRLLADLRSNAFAMPQATVKLLMALPLLTVMLGEGMGAHPLRFLLTGVKGWMCLGFAGCCYIVGLCWIRVLMRRENG